MMELQKEMILLNQSFETKERQSALPENYSLTPAVSMKLTLTQ